MEHVTINQLKRFMESQVEVGILDEDGGERAPFLKKTIKKIEQCPDGTHLRIYFDDFYFFAVPLTASAEQTDSQWTAFDQTQKLKYEIRKVCSAHE
ncbi:hypothetical protein [Mesobacillus harenae]|uniref:hypothetical protein n=1 Tax=Mesobacillus harenae TaxID=2213203 RepID=UPI0030D01852